MQRALSRRLSAAFIFAPIALIGLSGLAKLLDLPAFLHSLETWELIPPWLRVPIAVGVPCLELGLLGLWSINRVRSAAAPASIALLSIFSGAYVIHILWASPPACHCLGRLMEFDSSVSTARIVLARNAVLPAMLVIGLLLRRIVLLTDLRVAAHPRHDPPHAARGFTLPETIVSVLLVAVLVSLLAPSLSGLRRSGRDTSDAASLRAHVSAFLSYASDHGDTFPQVTDPLASLTIVRQGELAIPARYFDATSLWSVALSDTLYQTAWRDPSFFSRHRTDGPRPFTSFWHSSTLIAGPEYWNALTRTGSRQWRATRTAEVIFPAAKSALFRAEPWPLGVSELENNIVSAFLDGHASSISRPQLLPGYPTGEGPWPGSVFNYSVPTMHTIDGVRGRDAR